MFSRLAIVTLYDNINIGNKLQNYAVQYLCQPYSKYVTTLTYKEVLKEIGWKGKLAAFLGYPKKTADEKRLLMQRKAAFQEFTNKYLKTEPPRSYKDYDSTISGQYDMFITGSDQVWHNWTKTGAEQDYYFLAFTSREKRACISPSFGFDTLPSEKQEVYRKGLMGFDHLSCREKSGCELIKELTGREAELLVDPTMALTADEWDQIARKPRYFVPEKYVLVYFLGGISDKGQAYIQRICEENQWQMIDILDKKNKHWFLTTPDEFLYLVKNAAYVVTNSFHGCVFSIIYRKAFSVFSRIDSEAATMGARIDTLLAHFELQSRWMYTGDPNTPVDYNMAALHQHQEREKMLQYLETVLSKSAST